MQKALENLEDHLGSSRTQLVSHWALSLAAAGQCSSELSSDGTRPELWFPLTRVDPVKETVLQTLTDVLGKHNAIKYN